MKRQQVDAHERSERSHPARGAWIETLHPVEHLELRRVAPREGCVD